MAEIKLQSYEFSALSLLFEIIEYIRNDSEGLVINLGSVSLVADKHKSDQAGESYMVEAGVGFVNAVAGVNTTSIRFNMDMSIQNGRATWVFSAGYDRVTISLDGGRKTSVIHRVAGRFYDDTESPVRNILIVQLRKILAGSK